MYQFDIVVHLKRVNFIVFGIKVTPPPPKKKNVHFNHAPANLMHKQVFSKKKWRSNVKIVVVTPIQAFLSIFEIGL